MEETNSDDSTLKVQKAGMLKKVRKGFGADRETLLLAIRCAEFCGIAILY